MCPCVFQGHHQIHRIRGRGLKTEPFIKLFGFFREGMHHKGTDASNICGLQSPLHRIGKKIPA